jgi:Zn-dependent metalloprotease
MSKLIAILITLLLYTVAQSENTVLYGKRANDVVSGSEVVRFKDFSSIPNYVKFKKGQEMPFNKLNSWLNSLYSLDYSYGLELINVESDNLGFTHYRYRQTINNVPVRLSMFIVHAQNGLIKSMNGELFDRAISSSTISINEQEALNFALNFIDADTYKWEVESEENHLKWSTENNDATYYPKADLVFISKGGKITNEIKLAYQFNVYAHKPMSRQEVYVDAITGEILWTENKIHHVDEVGTAQTAYSGSQVMTSDNLGGGNYRLQETGRGNGIRTFNCNNDTISTNIDFINSSADWDLAGIDAYALDAHWGAEMTYDYYLNIHGRNSIDNNGYRLDSYVHYFMNVENAFWDGSRIVYGDGFSNTNTTPFTSMDVVAHEITHGLTSFTSDLIYQAESGALNESFSDIFGVTIDYASRPTSANWIVGEEINGIGYRDMENPNIFNNPDTYLGDFWHPIGWGGSDNDGVHTNVGVQNFWYVLLTEGGAGVNDIGNSYSVSGLGLDKAAQIAYRNLTIYLTPSSEYQDARFYSIISSVDLYGDCSPEVESVTNAWYAVGVGDAYAIGAYSDFEACNVSSCEVPLTVEFTNYSQNSSYYYWDFGDGDTSTTYNPIHTYNDFGSYSVKLRVDGYSSCGNDSLIKTDFINIDPLALCNTYVPNAGTINLSECSGRLFDSGGPCSGYETYENAKVIIQPYGSQQVDLNFILFDVEAGDEGGAICNYDFLQIYDGPSTLSPLIGTYCNNNLPPNTISSTGNALTLVFEADIAVQYKGFEIEWSCVESTLSPVADFKADVDSCSGEVNFTDMSINGPAIWVWNFGDGEYSNVQNPTHQYEESGNYSVQLTVTNSIGSDTKTIIDYVYVNKPPVPIVVGDTICSDTTANLYAYGQGTINWYALPTTDYAIGTGSHYTTNILTSTRTFYVEDVYEDGPTQSLGKVDNTGSGNFYGDGGLEFVAYTDLFIKSVNVYAESEGDVNVILLNKLNQIVGNKIQHVYPGLQTLNLNFNVEAGGYSLELYTNNSDVNLYRNTSSFNYPYTISEFISITNSINITDSDPGSGYYNYFYDWKVKKPHCRSPRVPVVAEVSTCVGIDELNLEINMLSYYNNLTDNIIIKFNNKLKGKYHLMIVNNLGQVFSNEILSINEDEKTHTVDMKGKAKGIYFLSLRNEKGLYSNKIIK